MLFGVRLKLRQNCLKRQVCMHHACMTSKSIAILRSRRPHASETAVRAARDRGPSADSHAVPARAAQLRATPLRSDAERHVHTVRDPMVSMGDIEVGIGTSSMSSQLPNRPIFAPRGAFGCGCAMFTGGRIRDPMPSGTPAPFPHTMRGRPDRRSASALPVLTGVAGGQTV